MLNIFHEIMVIFSFLCEFCKSDIQSSVCKNIILEKYMQLIFPASYANLL